MSALRELNSRILFGPVWDRCISLAFDAASAGSFGIGAVITNERGRIVSSGRNQLFDKAKSGNKLRNCPVAHAEINAIANLPEKYRNDKGAVLYATVEPCRMCTGAIALSSIKRIVIGTRDPWAGGIGLLQTDSFMKRKGIKVEFVEGVVAEICFYLNILTQKSTSAEIDDVGKALRTALPIYYNRAAQLAKNQGINNSFANGDIALFVKTVLQMSKP
jgi:tRNA(adenine34) deaminase